MKFTVDCDVPVPMADGTKLMAHIWRPEVDHPVPVVLQRLPYGKDNAEFCSPPDIYSMMRAGYAVAFQDCRGTGSSEGTFVPHWDDPADGVDTIAWLAAQPWCDGTVAMASGSYLGMVQWQAAAAGAPALKAIAPMVTSADFYRAPWYSAGGAFSLDTTMNWCLSMALAACGRRMMSGADTSGDLPALMSRLGNPEWLRETPVADQPLISKYLPWFDEVLAHPSRDAFWHDVPCERIENVTAPGMTIAGWYDLFMGESLQSYVNAQAHAGGNARGNQRLIVGPWSHGKAGTTGMFHERQFGPAAAMNPVESAREHIAFYDRWLRGNKHALDGYSPVRIFVMGIDQWRDEQAWPLHDTNYVDYHLEGQGKANTAAGDGMLSTTSAAQDATDRFLYDPLRPVPSIGGVVLFSAVAGPADQKAIEERDDVLVYSTPVLDEPVEVTGPVKLVLHVSSSAVDTDFTGKLVDVYPDGRAMILCEGIQRMRYRDSLAEPKLMTSGEVYEITIDMTATSNVFLPGHRIRLEVSSSCFPRYNRNSNTGGSIFHERAADMIPAVNSVHHGSMRPSRLVLPIIRR